MSAWYKPIRDPKMPDIITVFLWTHILPNAQGWNYNTNGAGANGEEKEKIETIVFIFEDFYYEDWSGAFRTPLRRRQDVFIWQICISWTQCCGLPQKAAEGCASPRREPGGRNPAGGSIMVALLRVANDNRPLSSRYGYPESRHLASG